VATLILMVAGRGIAKRFSNGDQVPFPDVKPYVFMTNGYFLYFPFCVTIVAIVFVFTWLMTRRTAIGMFVESVGNNETASRFCGINARLVKLLAYGFSGFCAGLAGMVAASNSLNADPANIGLWMELDAIFAVVVGGTALTGGRFSLVGSILGAILLGTLTKTMYFRGVPPAVAPVPKAIVIVAVCLLQSPQFRRRIVSIFRRQGA
jgi:simple sugar transport system permease protein